MQLYKWGFFFSVAALSVVAMPVRAAAVFCVNSQASAQAALNTAKNNGEADLIKFQSGTYSLTTGLVYATNGAADHKPLFITGGYNAGCTQRTGTTVLDGQDLLRPLLLSLYDADQVFVDHMTLFRGYTDDSTAAGANMSVIMYNQAGGAQVRIELNQFLLGTAEANTSGGLAVSGYGTLYLRGNLFRLNEATSSPAGSINLNGTAYVTSNTISGNSTPNGNGNAFYAHMTSASSHFWFSNNIIWGNATSLDLYLIGTGTFDLIHNDIGSRTNVNLGPDSGGDVSVDPQFAECGFFCLDLPLKRSSPLIDYAEDNPPGGQLFNDLRGTARIIGPHADVGAFELDRLFAHGFDSSFLP